MNRINSIYDIIPLLKKKRKCTSIFLPIKLWLRGYVSLILLERLNPGGESGLYTRMDVTYKLISRAITMNN